jgi:hypothetical protein
LILKKFQKNGLPDFKILKDNINGTTTYYPGRHNNKEVITSGTKVQKFYFAIGMTIAVRSVQNNTDTLQWILPSTGSGTGQPGKQRIARWVSLSNPGRHVEQHHPIHRLRGNTANKGHNAHKIQVYRPTGPGRVRVGFLRIKILRPPDRPFHQRGFDCSGAGEGVSV